MTVPAACGSVRDRLTITLAIETSQRIGGVAVRGREGAAHVESLKSAHRHDDDLLPAIDRLMKRVEFSPSDLGAVGVSIGPGGFTGLRIAVSTAKMVAEAMRVPLVAVPSAMVAAESSHEPGPLLVALAGKRDTFWATRFESRNSTWMPIDPGRLVHADEVGLDELSAVIADEHLPAAARRRCEERGLPIVAPVFEAAACLAVTERLLAAGQTTDALALAPLYPRPPEAVVLWEQRVQRGRTD
jgi:tRNA threonylcarbamoyladenosine biosynthesis protein TsaB